MLDSSTESLSGGLLDSGSDLGSTLGDMTTGFLGATVAMLVDFFGKSVELFSGSAS